MDDWFKSKLDVLIGRTIIHEGKQYRVVNYNDWEASHRVLIDTAEGELEIKYSILHEFIANITIVETIPSVPVVQHKEIVKEVIPELPYIDPELNDYKNQTQRDCKKLKAWVMKLSEDMQKDKPSASTQQQAKVAKGLITDYLSITKQELNTMAFVHKVTKEQNASPQANKQQQINSNDTNQRPSE